MQISIRVRHGILAGLLALLALAGLAAPSGRKGPVRVILMIGDGMGLTTVAHAHYHRFGADGRQAFQPLAMESLPASGFAYTHALDRLVTDSAAAATALLSGHKTRVGRLGVDADGRAVPTLLEEAAAAGLATGVLTTVPLTHATPAATFAHVADRSDYAAIFGWLLKTRPDVAIGWGAGVKSPYLPADYAARAAQAGYRVCDTPAALAAAPSLPLLAIFEGDHLISTEPASGAGAPRLSDLTAQTLDLLGRDPEGFFLLVEGGAIDWANHGQNLPDAVVATLEFDRAVDTVRRWVEAHGGWGNTLLVVTADHETGELTVRNPAGMPDDEDAAVPVTGWSLVPGAWAGHTYGSKSHSASPVPVFAAGQGSERLAGAYDNTRIYEILRSLLPPVKPVRK